MADGLNQARALRVAEIMNDYRTLLVHISQLNVRASQEDQAEEGFREIRDCLAAANALMASGYSPSALPAQASNEEAERVQLQRVILDGSARRFQAHRIYLRAAAAKRWVMHRENILRGHRPGPQHSPQLKAIGNTFRQELAGVTNQYVAADLRAADMRAGHWLNDDPSLEAILSWIRSHP
ncbi:hypothetical protein P175DRAFT_0508699 [Aspergillus ochraceoroseus IBT 24754]|uniref:Uncharacterized protein n=3 Tax=Aspergillus subgen. Nidulantes TaxID=2720870 RepID=A0A0F8VFJ3_9EURO|nr:uncharacterized protein P175DRAFT_0508699 [Aspergillus ochraceoroseus IBT 24754]KKK17105.1 hypothetical protein AOCH_006513 [Aspergillus ochraceoroseus]KKK21851.1 hypothetical protein ARAM_002887 [Aspergillus rambellii]PTU21782.1 hypothetical protein P175DRAFT_0508699 [Aspergillus ochraceoroseus IBT 24754]